MTIRRLLALSLLPSAAAADSGVAGQLAAAVDRLPGVAVLGGTVALALYLLVQMRGHRRLARLNRELEGQVARRTRALAERAAVLGTALGSLDSAVVAVDAEDLIVTCNSRFPELFQLDGGIAPGMPRARLLERLNARASRFGGGGWEGALLPPTAAAVAVDRDLRLPSGEVIEIHRRTIGTGGYVATFSDVTARRMTELAPTGGSVGVWDRDLRRGAMICSDPYWRMLGYDPRAVPEAVRQRRRDDWLTFVHPDDRALASSVVERALAGEGPLLLNCRLRHLSGRWLWITVRGRIVRDEHGEPVRVVGTHTQIDATVRAQEALSRARQAAEEEARHKSRFLATLGHELRTPLTGILGNLELLVRELPGGSHDRVARVRDAGVSLLQVLDGVLEMARAEAGRLTVRQENFSPRRLLAEVAELLEPLARGKRLAVRVVVDDAVPAYLLGGLPLLRQILVNLISNAIKFTETGGVAVAMAADAERDCYRIEVRDTGRGMSRATLARVFDEFYRGPRTIEPGAGLGLFIAARLVEAVGGSIDVDSEPDGGSRFRIRLSLAPGQAPAGRPAGEPPGPLTLLLVEDVAANREMTRELLARDGHRVDAVADGAAAVAAVRDRPYDAVLMDLRLDAMDGAEAARHIRELSDAHRAATPIVALTADADRLDEGFCLATGIDAVVGKPVRLEVLYMALSDLCAGADGRPADTDHVDVEEADRLAELNRILGTESVRALLGEFAATLSEQDERLAVAWAKRDRPGLMAVAHRLAGAADNFGFGEVARAARAVRAAPEAALEVEVAALRAVARDTEPRVRELARGDPEPDQDDAAPGARENA